MNGLPAHRRDQSLRFRPHCFAALQQQDGVEIALARDMGGNIHRRDIRHLVDADAVDAGDFGIALEPAARAAREADDGNVRMFRLHIRHDAGSRIQNR